MKRFTNPQAHADSTVKTRVPLYYTFGNHMHWVDMQWLWGYFVLPASINDMLAYCDATGAKGNINFDGIGYEKLAAEAPDALERLREAVHDGRVEIVGGSYGQPYGLFHGGESNVRQRIYGVRVAERLLGKRPVTFWEEEFDFFPQLPQMLTATGYRYASLFFQWTWHTPAVPVEQVPAVMWEGIDGSCILTATRNALNLHQWPEDFAEILSGDSITSMPNAGLVQWLELLPSDDWMCRSELIAPQMRAIADSERFDLRFVTLSEYLDACRTDAPVRHYGLGDVFHGMSLGKNGDLFRRLSTRGESVLLAAEGASVTAAFLGRPYPSWDVYPVWELEESWRELLSAQHHDNDECEGLCGSVGRRSYERSSALAGDVLGRTLEHFASLNTGAPVDWVVFNPVAIRRRATIVHDEATWLTPELPSLGYRLLNAAELTPAPIVTIAESATTAGLIRGDLALDVDRRTGAVRSLRWRDAELLPHDHEAPGIGSLSMMRGGKAVHFDVTVSTRNEAGVPHIDVLFDAGDGYVHMTVAIAPEADAIDICFRSDRIPVPDGNARSSLSCWFPAPHHERASEDGTLTWRLLHDHPYGVSEIGSTGTFVRKYPTGDWMTSPQFYEELTDPFTALGLFDFMYDDRGLLVVHESSQAHFRETGGVRTVLSMNDPWDEDYFVRELDARFRLVPHDALDYATLWNHAQTFRRAVYHARVLPGPIATRDGPRTFETAITATPGVAITAIFRESLFATAGTHTPETLATDPTAIDRPDAFAYPIVVRVVELNGTDTTACVSVAGAVARAVRTNLLGEPLGDPPRVHVDPKDGPIGRSTIELELRHREIATVYLEIEQARKVPRLLDSYRDVWAHAHHVPEDDRKDPDE